MEILAASLTAITYWLVLFYFLKGRRERHRERAGALLCEAKRCYRRWYWTLAGGIFICALVFSKLALLVCYGMRPITHLLLQVVSSWDSPLFLTTLLGTIFKAPLLLFVLNWSLEFRERALLICQGPMSYLIPWSRVKYAAFSADSGKLEIRTGSRTHKVDLSDGETESVLAGLASVVETRDRSGLLVHAEVQARRQELAGKTPLPSWRFQFDLRTMLLFVLFASAAMSWYGIRYHRDEAERAALARLDPFKPTVVGQPFVLWIDFSSSPVKPGDDDLALLSDLARLDDLSLAHAPITDAGLVHLERLTLLHDLDLSHTSVSDEGLKHLEKILSLRRVVLRHTRVTKEGVERLKRALPNVEAVK